MLEIGANFIVYMIYYEISIIFDKLLVLEK